MNELCNELGLLLKRKRYFLMILRVHLTPDPENKDEEGPQKVRYIRIEIFAFCF